MDQVVFIPFVIYLLVIVLVSLFFWKLGSKSMENFFLGGRRINRFTTVVSTIVSGRSGFQIFTLIWLTYITGISAIWGLLGYVIFEFLSFRFIGPKVKEFAHDHDCTTFPEYISNRFSDKYNILRTFLSLIILVCCLFLFAVSIVFSGSVIKSFLGFDELLGMIITGVALILYCIIGGYFSVLLTDIISFILLLLFLVVVSFTGIFKVGGWDVISTELSLLPKFYSSGVPIPGTNGNLLNPFSISLLGAIIGFFSGIGGIGSPHVFQRYMSVNNAGEMKRMSLFQLGGNLFIVIFSLIAGLVSRAYFSEFQMVDSTQRSELLYGVSKHLVPHFFWGILLLVFFINYTSMAGSQLLISTGVISKDIYEKLLHYKTPVKPDIQRLFNRFIITLIAISGVVLASIFPEFFIFSLDRVWITFFVVFSVPVILSVFWYKTSWISTLAGSIAGASVCLFTDGTFYHALLGFSLNLLISFLLSFIFVGKLPEKRKEKTIDVIHDPTQIISVDHDIENPQSS